MRTEAEGAGSTVEPNSRKKARVTMGWMKRMHRWLTRDMTMTAPAACGPKMNPQKRSLLTRLRIALTRKTRRMQHADIVDVGLLDEQAPTRVTVDGHYLQEAGLPNYVADAVGAFQSTDEDVTRLSFKDPPGNSCWERVPPELWLMIIHQSVDGALPTTDIGTTSELVSGHLPAGKRLACILALTCRAGLDICAPVLYSSLEVRSERIEEFLESLRTGLIHLRRFTSRVVFSGPGSWAAYARVARAVDSSLPNVSMIVMRPDTLPAYYDPAFCHTAYPHFAPLIRAASSNIHSLTLQRCSFIATSDVVHLLGSFPCLLDATLAHVSWSQSTSSLVFPRNPSALRHISIDTVQASFDLTTLLLAWRCSRPLSSRKKLDGFVGLGPAEARAVAAISRCLHPAKVQDLHLDAMPNARSWVAWIEYKYCHLEFHITSAALDVPDPRSSRIQFGHVRHVVLRLRQHDSPDVELSSTRGLTENSLECYFVDGIKGLLEMRRALHEFSELQSITVEGSGPGSWHIGTAASLAIPVMRTTCADARSAAMDVARECGSHRPRPFVHQPPASPLWSLAQYERIRHCWLSWYASATPAPVAHCVAVFEGRPLRLAMQPTSTVGTNMYARHPRSELEHIAMALYDDALDNARKEYEEALSHITSAQLNPWFGRYTNPSDQVDTSEEVDEDPEPDPTLAMAQRVRYGGPVPESELGMAWLNHGPLNS